MFSKEDITAKAWLVKEVVNVVLHDTGQSVDRIFLVGSYASGRANDYSDIDYLIQLKGGRRQYTLPTWKLIQEVNKKIDNKRIHVIYGTLEAQQSLWNKDAVKYSFREIQHGDTYTPSAPV